MSSSIVHFCDNCKSLIPHFDPQYHISECKDLCESCLKYFLRYNKMRKVEKEEGDGK